MREATARDFCAQCIDHLYSANSYVENLAVQFTKKAKNGDFDALSEEEYKTLLAETEELAKLWNNRPRRAAGDILMDILANAPAASHAQKNDLAAAFAGLLADPEDKVPPLPDGISEAMENFECDYTEKMLDDLDQRFDDIPDEVVPDILECPSRASSPKEIRDSIAQQVMGQREAVKAAALITYNHLAGRRTNAVFCGPSGCGKSEIWRCLSYQYPGLVRMVDFSRFSAEGWSGSLHLRDIFEGIKPSFIKRRGLIVVLDEADKILCEHAVGGGGTDHNALLQNDLLKMMDGDIIEFGGEGKKDAMTIDCSKVSVVMLGAFERLLEGKAHDAKHIGFGSGAANVDAGKHKDISYDDLIHAGMRREIAGRINRIAALDPLSVDDYKSILKGPVLSGLQQSLGCRVHIDGATAGILAEQAAATGLGVRWMKSALRNAIDDAIFDAPEAKEWSVIMRDGGLRCRARKPREAAPVGRRAASTAPGRLMSA